MRFYNLYMWHFFAVSDGKINISLILLCVNPMNTKTVFVHRCINKGTQ